MASCTHLQSSPPHCPDCTKDRNHVQRLSPTVCCVANDNITTCWSSCFPVPGTWFLPALCPPARVSCRDPGGNRAELRNGPHDSGTQPCSASDPDGTMFSDTSSPPCYCDLRVCGTALVLTRQLHGWRLVCVCLCFCVCVCVFECVCAAVCLCACVCMCVCSCADTEVWG